MKKFWLLFLLAPGFLEAAAPVKQIFNPFTGRLDYITNVSSLVAGDLPGLTTNFAASGVSYANWETDKSTSVGQAEWNVAKNTATSNSDFTLHTTTADALTRNLLTWTSTANAQVNNYIAINASNTNIPASSNTWTANQTMLRDFTFQTTVTVTSNYPSVVYNSTAAIANSTSALNGLALLDSNTSTAGANACIFLLQVPDNFVSGSTPILVHLGEMTTGYMDAQSSWVLSFATVPANGLIVSTGTSSLYGNLQHSDLNFSSAVVVNFTGTNSAQGGTRENKSIFPLNGVTNMVGSGNCVLAVQAVRDGTSPNDTSNVQSAIYALRFKIRAQM